MGKLSFIVVLIVLTFAGFAQSPHGAGFKTDCIDCHTSKSWQVSKATMSFDHNTTPFKLTGQHEVVDCISCHKTLKFLESRSECVACHTDMHNSTLGPDCARCHDTKAWIIKNTITMHQMSRFPLHGNHTVLECASCHKSSSNLQFEPMGVECIDCHKKDYLATTAPNHQKHNYPFNCVECHGVTATGWTTSNFDHNSFPLTDGHNINCVACHQDGRFQKIATECVSCHQVQYDKAKGHVASKFSTDCKTCHSPTRWSDGIYNHTQTKFQLTGAHVSVACASCHVTGYAGTSMECKSCHQAKYTSTLTPNHTKAGLSVDCKTCHTTTAWQPSSFNHTTTGFTLTGSHAAIVQCSDCHLGSTTTTSPDCVSCHQVQYNNASGHVASKFPTDCKLCHSSTNWLGATFDHSKNNFPLTGAHVSVACASCHVTGYAGTSMECKSCHQAKYTSTLTPNHSKAGLSVDCKTCHTTTAWQPSSFNHNTTGFTLTGSHAAIVQCSDCHLGTTSAASPECISCHQVQYNGASGHVASKFPTDCKLCHSSTNWLGATFDHSKNNFPLTGAHVSVACASCHVTGYAGTSMECKSCHQAKYTSTLTPNHTKAGIPVDCKTCHTTTTWQPSSFNHSTTGFTLTGSHAAIIQCSDCHLGSTTPAKPECISCHQVQYNTAKGHVASKFPTDCKLCHSSTNWLGATFDHSKNNFPLTGTHVSVACASCHVTGYAGTSMECKSCHQAKYTSTLTPNHTKAGLSVDCKTCHTTTAWQPSSFNHTTTGFTLTGSHAAIVQCSDCHLGSTTTAKPECISCHQVQYNTAKGHVASKFPTDCKLCHSSTNWLGATFDHSKNNFPLTGVHVSVQCASCHVTGYAGTSMECKSCHQAKYTSTLTPNHTKAGLSVDCKTCHTTTAWQPSSFNHTTTGFTLTGSHAAIVQCSDCHLGSTTTVKPECISCHQVQYNTAKGHVASKFPTDCKLCHSSTNWLGATFDHSKNNFPLTGAHVSVACASCHVTGYAGTSMECKSCHQAKYTSTLTPNHTKAGLSVDCKTCHTTTAWQPSSFYHSTTGFTLTGSHAAIVQCSDCHLGTTSAASPECITCHQVQYNGASGHVASKFPTDCKLCHSSTNWLGATFDHSKNNFPLTGAHVSVQCASCHVTGYAGTSMECKSCHQAKYTSTLTPNHTKAGIPVDCKTCHTTTAWQPSSFNHSTTGFTLTGSHAAIVQCSDCHLGSTTIAKPECISCHQVQYNGASGHVASKFPTDCKLCHSSTNWLGATFDHSKNNFPLTGAHLSVQCASCHVTGYAGTSMECKSCHQAKYTSTLTPNHTKAGLSVDCKTCHTTTTWQPSSFNHSTTGFTLTGSHAAIIQCSDCHLGSTTAASPECVSCHQVQYNNAKGHVASKFPTDCKLCHSSTNWLGATFDHSKNNFPLTGAHVSVQCASCHVTGYAGTSMECKSCHQAKYTSTLTPNHTKAGIPVDCKTCHTTTAWQPSSFNHSTTGFTLTGSHVAIVQCSDCHLGTTSAASPECITCHQVQYNGANGHVASKFPTDCKLCHSSTNWLGATFDHSKNNFPLTGAHVSVQCASCHVTGYAGTSTICNSCHQTNYSLTTNPNHKTLGLSATCTDCHTTIPGWQPASFPIHSNFYPLTGGHATIANDCAACHKGVYPNTTKVCYACHTANYNSTTNPAHKAAQFPTDCTICHSVTAWTPSTYNHDAQYFPINSGKHQGVWKLCSECHTSPTNYAVFSCIICHEHNSKTLVDGDHRGVNGYTYNGTSCYSCHPTGRN